LQISTVEDQSKFNAALTRQGALAEYSASLNGADHEIALAEEAAAVREASGHPDVPPGPETPAASRRSGPEPLHLTERKRQSTRELGKGFEL
jgi:hypothetical protein